MTNELSSNVQHLRDEYTTMQPCCVDGSPDAHTVWLKIGVQRFCVTPYACDTAEDAQAYRVMLAKALNTLLQVEQARKAIHEH